MLRSGCGSRVGGLRLPNRDDQKWPRGEAEQAQRVALEWRVTLVGFAVVVAPGGSVLDTERPG